MDRVSDPPRAPKAPARRGDPPLVLVALEPRVYADAIGRTVADLRPGLEVLVIDPDELPVGEELWAPGLVLCNRPRPEGCAAAHWLEYRPYDEPDVVRVDGRAKRFPGLNFEGLLGLVDRLAANLPSGRRAA